MLKDVAPDPDPVFDRLLRAAADKSTQPAVRAAGGLLLGWRLADAAGASGDAKTAAEADAVLSGVAKEFGTQRWETVTVREVADQALKMLRTLAVGKPAPPLESTDLDGKPVKLADLKGKVVAVEFWSTNCPICVQMIPQETDLVKRLAGKPFALVSVSADRTKADLTEFLKKKPMPWTHWYAGPGSEAFDNWGVRGYPTVYLIDAKGVIRKRGLVGRNMAPKEIDPLVEALVAEAEAGK